MKRLDDSTTQQRKRFDRGGGSIEATWLYRGLEDSTTRQTEATPQGQLDSAEDSASQKTRPYRQGRLGLFLGHSMGLERPIQGDSNSKPSPAPQQSTESEKWTHKELVIEPSETGLGSCTSFSHVVCSS